MIDILNIISAILIVVYLMLLNITYKSENRKFALASVFVVVLFFMITLIKFAYIIQTNLFWKVILSGILSGIISCILFFSGIFFAIYMEYRREKNNKIT